MRSKLLFYTSCHLRIRSKRDGEALIPVAIVAAVALAERLSKTVIN